MSDPRDAYRTRGVTVTSDELVEIVGDVWHKEYENGVGDRISVAEAVINVVLEEAANILKAHAAEIVVLSDGKSHIEYLCLQRNIEAILALKSTPSEAKP